MRLWRWLPFLMNKRSEVHSTYVLIGKLVGKLVVYSITRIFHYLILVIYSLFDFSYIV
jgi:hypothetical protein